MKTTVTSPIKRRKNRIKFLDGFLKNASTLCQNEEYQSLVNEDDFVSEFKVFEKVPFLDIKPTTQIVFKSGKGIFWFLLFSNSILFFSSYLNAQQIVYYHQGFENACPDNWSYSGGNSNSEIARTGFSSCRIGRLGESNSILFNTVDVSGIVGSNLQIYHSVKPQSSPSAGEGMDTREGAIIQVQENGGSWITIGRVGGNNNQSWGWNQTGGTTNSCPQTYTMANPLNYTLSNGTNTITLRVISLRTASTNSSCPAPCRCSQFDALMNAENPTASTYDRSDEGLFIDDIQIMGLAPSVSSINNGVLCEGFPLDLFTTPSLGSMSSSWSGPNSFTSVTNNPNVSISAAVIHAGNYVNAISVNNCSIGSYSTSVTINFPPSIISISPP
ncbi:MAG: hypothetical protein K9G36_11460 [Crocinitomicaceae bacterium]|nr:hypothetical protein [Crocinitomicaceae bacterium]